MSGVTIDARDLGIQREWSQEAFGPSDRLGGVLEHILKEVEEVRANPKDVSEWVDILILALDGALRQGLDPSEIIEAYHNKVAANMSRSWPDWRLLPEDQAIEHVREDDKSETPADISAEFDLPQGDGNPEPELSLEDDKAVADEPEEPAKKAPAKKAAAKKAAPKKR